MIKSLTVDLRISADEFLKHYKGTVRQVICTARDGRKVRFPSAVLQRFVRHDGIHGTFCFEIDDNNKLVSVRQLV